MSPVGDAVSLVDRDERQGQALEHFGEAWNAKALDNNEKLLANPRKMPSMAGFNLEVTGYQAGPEQ